MSAEVLPSPGQVDALLADAHALRHQDARQALALSQQAHALALQIDYQRGVGAALLHWGVCGFIVGASAAEVHGRLQSAATLAQALDDGPTQFDALNVRALQLSAEGRRDAAVELFIECAALAEQAGDERRLSKALTNLAMEHQAEGRYPEALELLQRSLELCERLNDVLGQAYALANQGKVMGELGAYEDALRALQMSLAIDSSGLDLARQSTTHLQLGRILLRQGEPMLAAEHLCTAVTLSRRTGNHRDLCDALLGLAKVQLAQGEEVAADLSLNEAFALAHQTDDLWRQGAVQLALGRMLLGQRRHEEALPRLEAALQLAELGKDIALRAEAHETLGELAEARGDFRAALAHVRQFHGLRHQQHGERVQGQLRGFLLRGARRDLAREAEGERQRSQHLANELDAARRAEQEKQRLLEQLAAQTEMLQQLSREDGLTGVANRRWLDLQLASEFERARRFGHPLSLVMLDLDHFKSINDRFTHQVGDQVLRAVAALLRDGCRQSDLVGRYGGEEFVLLLVETPLERALQTCELLRQRLVEFAWERVHPELRRVSFSAGVVSNAQSADLVALLAAADERLYRAKAAGRDRVCAD